MSRPAPRWTRALASTAAVTTACVFPAFLIGAMAVQIRRDLGFGDAGVGLGVGSFFAAASVLSTPMGRVAERVGPTRALRWAGVVSGAASLAVAVSGRSLSTLLPLLALGGSANALCQPAANLLIARTLPPDRQGLGFAVKQSAIPLSTMLAGAVVPALALTVGWRWGFVLASGFALAGTLSVRAAEAPPPAGVAPATRRRGDVPPGVMLLLATGIGLGAAAAGSLGSFLVSAAVDAGMSEGGAGLLLTAGSIVGVVVRLSAGVRADRRQGGHLRTVAGMLAGGSVCFALLATGSVPAYLVAGPAAFATGWAWPGLFNLAIVRANPTAPAAATGVTQTGTYFGAVVGPLLFGYLAGARSYSAAWLTAAALALLSSALMIAGRRRLRWWMEGVRRRG